MVIDSTIQLKSDIVSADFISFTLKFLCVGSLFSDRFIVFYQAFAWHIYQNGNGTLMDVAHKASGSSRVIHF